jgi:hypothetical protein
MAEEQQENTNKDFPDSSDNSFFSSEENSLNTEGQEINTGDESGKHTKKNCYTHPNIIINNPANNDAEALEVAKEGNRIARGGLIASIIASAFTLGALWLSWQANQTTQEALGDARKKDLAAAVRERVIDSLDSIVRNRDFIRDTTNIGLSKQSLQTQINSIKETQNQFNNTHQPYLQVEAVPYLLVTLDASATVKYRIKNIGAVPVEMLSYESYFTFSGSEMKQGIANKVNTKGELNLYLIPQGSQEITVYERELTLDEWKQVKNIGGGMWFRLKINYKNLVSGSFYTYNFIIGVRFSGDVIYPDGIGFTFLKNENTPAK